MSQKQLGTYLTQETNEARPLKMSEEVYRLTKEYVYTPTTNKQFRYRKVTILIWSDLTVMKKQQTLLHSDDVTQQPRESDWSLEFYVAVKVRDITPAAMRDHFVNVGGYRQENIA